MLPLRERLLQPRNNDKYSSCNAAQCKLTGGGSTLPPNKFEATYSPVQYFKFKAK